MVNVDITKDQCDIRKKPKKKPSTPSLYLLVHISQSKVLLWYNKNSVSCHTTAD